MNILSHEIGFWLFERECDSKANVSYSCELESNLIELEWNSINKHSLLLSRGDSQNHLVICIDYRSVFSMLNIV